MANDYVFIGPTLALAEARQLLPDAMFLPPIQHGDLLRVSPQPGDRVLIVDGLFMGTPPVRHREILAVLEQGVQVAGSSSMGAMRAAELWPYGMRGVGRIFELFRDGVVTGDDEVAVVHSPAENGFIPLSEPLVNLRIALMDAVEAGQLTSAEAGRLLELGRSLPYRVRGPRALAAAARTVVNDDSFDRYLAWTEAHPAEAKADDARTLLRMAAEVPARLTVPNSSQAQAIIENVETTHYERWRARHRGELVGGRWVPNASTAAAIMALHPEFPALHRRHTLAHLAGADPEEQASVVKSRTITIARERGLLADPALVKASSWLTPAERDLAIEEAVLRILVRSFGTIRCAAYSEGAVPTALLKPQIVAKARQFVRSGLRLTDQLPRPDPHRPRLRLSFRSEVMDQIFSRLWDCPIAELEAAAWDRGFASLKDLHVATGTFAAILKVSGPPQFPS